MRRSGFPLLVALVLSAPAFGADPVRPPLRLERGDRICLVGNALAERMQHHGWLETYLQCHFPDQRLSLRNLGFSADEVGVQQRTQGFGSWDDYLRRCRADVVFAFFGFNESFQGEAGVEGFRRQLGERIAHWKSQDYSGRGPAEVVLFSSIAFEDLGDPSLPDGTEHNARLARYHQVMKEVAGSQGVVFVDLFDLSQGLYQSSAEPLTLNGIHLTEHGNQQLARRLVQWLFGAGRAVPSGRYELVREAVLEKNLLWFNRYRATDGYNVYGGRSSLSYTDGVSNRTVLQREMEILDAMCERRDVAIQARARGREMRPDDQGVPAPLPVKTNIPGPNPDGSHTFLDGAAAIDWMTVHEDWQVQLFADEKQFPELVNPVQMAWDPQGRLWVACWPTYPHWQPGRPMNDRLVILEDTTGDGRADHCQVFVDDLHNPTGFEFWNGGVLVANAPDLLFLQDTDGDGRADVRRRILHGLSSGDTHHSANSFVLGPGGGLYFQEGTFHQTQIETIRGPERCRDGCVWRFNPRTWEVERYVAYNFANPHGHVFDRWGQDFVTDGTGNQNYYALPFSGRVVHPDKHRGYFTFFRQRSRPAGGTEILSSAHFPEEFQGNYLIANVIGFRGIFQYEMVDQDSGFTADEVEPVVYSSDPSFRPVDLEIGPDGALYFVDWYNPIIGHMQHHLRDPMRDNTHGRVYRVTARGRPLVTPVAVAGRPVAELLDRLRSTDDRLRYRVRIELSGRDRDEVVSAVGQWVAGLAADDPDRAHHLLEAVWVLQHQDVADESLLRQVLASSEYQARAAATRVVRYLSHRLADPLALLRRMAADSHPRVRLEALVAASTFDQVSAVEVALEVCRQPGDQFLDYALEETLRTLEPVWRPVLESGSLISPDNAAGVRVLLARLDGGFLAALPRVPAVLEALLTRHGVDPSARRQAAEELARLRGGTPAEALIDAMELMEDSGGEHLRHIQHSLGALLLERPAELAALPQQRLVRLARAGLLAETRATGHAALLLRDGDFESAFQSVNNSREGTISLLDAIPLLPDPALRQQAFDRVRRLMFHLESGLRQPDGTGAMPGWNADYYSVRLETALPERFDSLSPDHTTRMPMPSVNVPGVERTDAFAVRFTGTLFVPESGPWQFSTRSDDGSRLFVDGRSVVDNDGAHGMLEKQGTVDLEAGPHHVLLTYYDQGGGEGLELFWKAPGGRKQLVPESAVSAGGEDPVRGAAVRAMASLPGQAERKFQDAARLIGEGVLWEPAAELLRGVPTEHWPRGQLLPLVLSIAAAVSRLPGPERTLPRALTLLEVGRELAGALPEDQSQEALGTLSGLGGTTILLRTLPHQMRYDRREFFVEKGQPVAVVFQNNDVMPHNLVVTTPGSLEVVGPMAETLGAGAAGTKTNYIPETDRILWHTDLLYPGEMATLRFVAPEETGDHPFVCTFPGHWRVMNGVMHVVDQVDPETMNTPVTTTVDTAPARDFVQMWTLADFAADLTPGWEERGSEARGLQTMDEAGCLKCHTFRGQGPATAPELDKVGEKYQGLDLLKQMLEPSAIIQEGYENFLLKTHDQRSFVGRILKEEDGALHVLQNLQEPDQVDVIPLAEIRLRKESTTSAMPTGLLVTFTKDEILDLLRALQAAAVKQDD